MQVYRSGRVVLIAGCLAVSLLVLGSVRAPEMTIPVEFTSMDQKIDWLHFRGPVSTEWELPTLHVMKPLAAERIIR